MKIIKTRTVLLFGIIACSLSLVITISMYSCSHTVQDEMHVTMEESIAEEAEKQLQENKNYYNAMGNYKKHLAEMIVNNEKSIDSNKVRIAIKK